MSRTLALALATLVAAPSAHAATITLPLPNGASGADLRIERPDGTVVERSLPGTGFITVDVGGWPAGSYQYDLQPRLAVDRALAARAQAQRAQGNLQRVAGWPGPLASSSGSFVVSAGGVLALRDPAHTDSLDATPESRQDGGVPGKRASAAKDQVIPDDLVVQGSTCTGLDCINNESFGFDTFRLKENNLRIHFDDTSSSAGFPANDWRIIANDSASGGANYFAIEDSASTRIPLRIEAGGPANQLYLDATGNVGIGQSAPGLDLHITTTDTPGVRFEQSNAGGFTPQTWDIGANEANFFVRDVTGGSLLPLRIRPGAPTSSIDISADGDVGVGSAAPAAALHVQRAASYAEPLFLARVAGDDPVTVPVETDTVRMKLEANGNLYVGGTIAQLSSRRSKENFVAVDGGAVLTRLEALPILEWNYIGQAGGDRHLGPTAEDFHAAFGLGESDQRLAPADVAGVALAAARALKAEVAERDRRIGALEARLAKLEAMLATPVAKD